MRFGAYTGGIFAALSALLWLTPAQADLVAFKYEGPMCSTGYGICNFGMAPGDTVAATLYFDSSSLAKGYVDWNDLIDFSITAGTFHIALADAVAYHDFDASYNGSTQTLLGYLAVAATNAPDIGPTAFLYDYFWNVGYGYYDAAHNVVGAVGDDFAEGDTSPRTALFSRVVVPAPEPITASLFAAGLAGIGLGRRRKHI